MAQYVNIKLLPDGTPTGSEVSKGSSGTIWLLEFIGLIPEFENSVYILFRVIFSLAFLPTTSATTKFFFNFLQLTMVIDKSYKYNLYDLSMPW